MHVSLNPHKLMFFILLALGISFIPDMQGPDKGAAKSTYESNTSILVLSSEVNSNDDIDDFPWDPAVIPQIASALPVSWSPLALPVNSYPDRVWQHCPFLARGPPQNI
jgi:hypothetical protein